MNLTTYYAPTRITFGPNAEDKVGEEIKKEGKKRVLIHYGSNRIEKSGLLAKVIKKLDEDNIAYILLHGVVPNPRLSLVRKGIELGKKENIDFILALGGGSVIDSSKAIGYGLKYDGDVWDFYSKKAIPKESVGVGAILTMAAAGSEMSDSSVITNDDGALKRGCNSDVCRLKFALLNPELTYTLPPYETSCAIVDIQMHTMERYFIKDYSLPLTEDISLEFIKNIKEQGIEALKNPTSYSARASLMWGSSISHNGLMALGNSARGDWATHQIEHELSGKYDIAHGAGLAIVWPAWARYTLSSKPEKFAHLGYRVFDLEKTSDSLKDGEKTIEAFISFYKSINMPTHLSDLNIFPTEDDIEELASKASFFSTRTLGDIRVLEKDDIKEIYRLMR